VRAEDFTSLYANNVHFESSVWDLKLLFGLLDQIKGAGNAMIDQHTAINIPWVQAKLVAYFLTVNVMLHESENGKLEIPTRIIPIKLDPSDPALDDKGKSLTQYLAWVHDQFFGSDPYIPPGVDPTKL
jgi:hypothetical protein